MTVDEFVEFVIDYWVDSGWDRAELISKPVKSGEELGG